MTKTCGITALLVFASSAAFHFASYFPAVPVSMALAWPLHLATMAVFAMMSFSIDAQLKRQPKLTAKGFFARWHARNQQYKEIQSKPIAFAPRPLRIACIAAFIYAFINFALFMVLMEGGSPSVKNGNYYLQSHGRKIRDLTKDEYLRFQSYEVRGFSGHWMFFSIIPMTYFLTVYPRLQPGGVGFNPPSPNP